MPRIVSFFILLFPFSLLYAQGTAVSPDISYKWYGEKLNTQNTKILKANRRIVGFDLDTTNQFLYLRLQEEKNGKLRSKGSLVCYDLLDNKVRWENDFNFSINRFLLHDTIPLFVDQYDTYFLARLTGKVSYISSIQIEFCIPGKTIGVGTSPGTAKAIIGVDLNTGLVKWNFKEEGVYDLESATFIGDSVMIISSKGIHYINLDSGQGFSHKVKMEKRTSPHSAVIMGGVMGGILGAALAYAIRSAAVTPGRDAVGNIKSNIEVHNDIIYFAGLKDLYAVNTEGDILWTSGLPNVLKPLSKVFVYNDLIYVINNGIIKLPEGNTYGEIYLSKWDPETGDLISDLFPGKIKGEYINDFFIRDETVVLALSNGMAEYSLADFSLINEKSFGNPTISSGLGNIVTPPYYLMNDGKMENRTETNPEEIYIENSNGMKIAFSPELEITSVVRKPNFYSFSQYAGPWIILENGTNAIVINDKNEILNEIPFSNNLKFINGYFYDYKDDRFIVAPADIIEN